MDKQFLLSFIDKYYLNGLVERSKWEIKDKNVTTNIVSANKDMVGIVSSAFEINDVNVAIYDTTQLLKLLNITNNLVTLNVVEEFTIPIKLLIDDSEFSLEYSLADPFLISKPPTITEPNYDFELSLTKDDINKFIKSKKALESNSVSIKGILDKKGNSVEFTLGDNNKHANKVKFNIISPNITKTTDKLEFDSNNIKEIFVANKDMEQGTFAFSNEGLIKFSFENELKQKSTYFLVSKTQ